jgi:hypothetical protein
VKEQEGRGIGPCFFATSRGALAATSRAAEVCPRGGVRAGLVASGRRSVRRGERPTTPGEGMGTRVSRHRSPFSPRACSGKGSIVWRVMGVC